MNKFQIIKEEEFFKTLNQVIVISGGYFGDESKGKTVESMLRNKNVKYVIRANSGANAGHTVVLQNGKKIITHITPSGICHKNIINIIGQNCFLDPIGYMNEVASLQKESINMSNLLIDNTFIVTPFHICHDLVRGLNSTGRGMTQVAVDKVSKSSLKLQDLLNTDRDKVFRSFSKWNTLSDKNIETLYSSPRTPDWIKEFISLKSLDKKVDYYISIFDQYKSFYIKRYKNTSYEIFQNIKNKSCVLECSQSYFLSNDIISHHYNSTSSATHSAGVIASFPIISKFKTSNISVVKIPSSRVGLGANPSGLVSQDWFEKKNLNADNMKDFDLDFYKVYNDFLDSIKNKETLDTYFKYHGKYFSIKESLAVSQSLFFGEFGATTKRPRVTGFLDLLHLRGLVRNNGENISISCIDRYVGLIEVLIVESYIYRGDTKLTTNGYYKNGDIISIKNPLPDENILENCECIYKVLRGWDYIVKNGKLHPNLDKFLSHISSKTKCNIISIGTGPKSRDLLYLKNV